MTAPAVLPDVEVREHGNLVLMRLKTPAAGRWAMDNVQQAACFLAGDLVVSRDHELQVCRSMMSAGLVVVGA